MTVLSVSVVCRSCLSATVDSCISRKISALMNFNKNKYCSLSTVQINDNYCEMFNFLNICVNPCFEPVSQNWGPSIELFVVNVRPSTINYFTTVCCLSYGSDLERLHVVYKTQYITIYFQHHKCQRHITIQQSTVAACELCRLEWEAQWFRGSVLGGVGGNVVNLFLKLLK